MNKGSKPSGLLLTVIWKVAFMIQTTLWAPEENKPAYHLSNSRWLDAPISASYIVVDSFIVWPFRVTSRGL